MTKPAKHQNMGPMRRFLKDAEGSSTVESLFWVPVFAFILILIVDTSFIFYGRTQVLRIMQDNNRSFSIGRLTTTSQLTDAIEAEMANLSDRAIITASVSAGIVTTRSEFPATDLMAVGSLSALSGITMTVVSKQYVEQ